MKTKLLRSIVFCIMLTASTFCAGSSVTVELKVVGEDHQPVADADVVMSFLLGQGRNMFKGHTDENGYVKATKRASFGVSISVTKDGYYRSSHRTGYGDQDLTLVLRDKKNPVAMYAKRINQKFEKSGFKYGYDFIVGDFVAPVGRGVHTDIEMVFTRRFTDQDNYINELILSFPNQYDGVINAKTQKDRNVSVFISDYLAPLGLYEARMVFSGSRINNIPISPNNINKPLYLRIRTEASGDDIVKAQYCKIWSGFGLHNPFSKNPGVTFSYHCNPTPNDRNVEFDSFSNLFHDLTFEEKPRITNF